MTPASINREAGKAHRSPSDAQKRTGNYRKGHAKLHGLDITIENAKGSTRSGRAPGGKKWSVTMPAHYGYVRGTEGADGDHHDVYVGPTPASKKVFVVDQVDADKGTFDEHKSMLGFVSHHHAASTYERGFSDGKGAQRIGGITHMSIDEWRDWIKGPKAKKPLAKFVQAFADGGAVGGGLPSFDEMGEDEPTGATDKPMMFDDLPSFDDMPGQHAPDQPELSAGQSFAISAAHAAPAAIGAVPAMAAGAELGATVGAVPFFSVPTAGISIPIGAFLGGAAGGFAGGAAISWLQGKLEESLGLAPTVNKYTEAAREQHPMASFTGELAPNLATFRPDRSATIAMRALSGGGQGGLEAGQELYNEGTIDPKRVGVATAFGAVNTHPTKLGDKLINTGQRTVAGIVPGRPDLTQTGADADKDDASSSTPPRTTLGVADAMPPPIEDQPTIGNPASAPVRDKGNMGGYAKLRRSSEGVATLTVGENDPAIEAALNEAFGVTVRDRGADLMPPDQPAAAAPAQAAAAAPAPTQAAPPVPETGPWSLPAGEDVTDHPHIPGLKIVRNQPLDSGLAAMPDHDTVQISDRVPRGIDVNGKTLDPAYPMAMREAATESGVSRLEQEEAQQPLFRMTHDQMRMRADLQMGQPAEKAWIEAHGYDYNAYREIIDGLDAKQSGAPAADAHAEPVEPRAANVEQPAAERPAVEQAPAPEEQRAPAPVEPAGPERAGSDVQPTVPPFDQLEPGIPDFLRRGEAKPAEPKPVTATVTPPEPGRSHGRTRPMVSLTGEPVAAPEPAPPKLERPGVVARVVEQLRAQGMNDVAQRIEGLPNEQAAAAAIKARKLLRPQERPKVEGAEGAPTAPTEAMARKRAASARIIAEAFDAHPPVEGEDAAATRTRLQSAVDQVRDEHAAAGNLSLYKPNVKAAPQLWLREAQKLLRKKTNTPQELSQFVANEKLLRSGDTEAVNDVRQEGRIDSDINLRRGPQAEDVGATHPDPLTSTDEQERTEPFPSTDLVAPEDVESTTPAQEVPKWKLVQMAEEAQRRSRMEAQKRARQESGIEPKRADNGMSEDEAAATAQDSDRVERERQRGILSAAKDFVKDENGAINLQQVLRMTTALSGAYRNATAPPSRRSYISRNPRSEPQQMNRDMADALHAIDKAQAQDKISHLNDVRDAPKTDQAAIADPKIEEDMYVAHEKGDAANLTGQARDIYDQYAKPILDDNALIHANIKTMLAHGDDEFTRLLLNDLDPDYLHRMAKGHNPAYDAQTGASADPVEGFARALNTTTGALQARKFFTLEGSNGRRVVVSGADGGFKVWRNGRDTFVKAPDDFLLQPGEKMKIGGQDFEVVQSHTPEIEQNARFASGEMASYHKNLMASAIETNVKLKAVERHLTYINGLKQDPDFLRYAVNTTTPQGRAMAKQMGWRESSMPQMRNWAMDDQLRYAFDDYSRPGIGTSDALDKLRRFSQAVTKTMFWMPVPHMLNVGVHWWTGRGWDWVKPTEWRHLGQELSDSYFSVMRQDGFQQQMREHGAGTVYDGVITQDFLRNMGRSVGMDISRNPAAWEPIAEKLGLGTGAAALTDLNRKVYQWSSRTMWAFNDVLLTHAVKAKMRQGMSMPDAIVDAEKDIPNYRIPSTILTGGKGGRAFQQVLSDPTLFAFGRYHYGVYNGLANIAKSLATGTGHERVEAMGKVFALGLFAFMVKPALDSVAQFITGNENAEMHPRGPLAPLRNAAQYARGEKDVSALAKSAATLAPWVSTILEAYDNKDFAGRTIAEPGQSFGTQALREGEHAVKGLYSPYGTVAGAMGRDQTVAEGLRDSVLDIKNPSERAARYQATLPMKNFQKANQANKHPLGPLEKALQ